MTECPAERSAEIPLPTRRETSRLWHGGRSRHGYGLGCRGRNGRRAYRRRRSGGGHRHRRQRRPLGRGGIAKARHGGRLRLGGGPPYGTPARLLRGPWLERLEQRQPGRIAERRAAGIHLPGSHKRIVLETRPSVLKPDILDRACPGTGRTLVGRRGRRRSQQEGRTRKGTKHTEKTTGCYGHGSASFLTRRRAGDSFFSISAEYAILLWRPAQTEDGSC